MRLLSVILCMTFVLYVTPVGAEPLGSRPLPAGAAPGGDGMPADLEFAPFWLAQLEDAPAESEGREGEEPKAEEQGDDLLESEEPLPDTAAMELEIRRLLEERSKLGVGRAIGATATGGALFLVGAVTAFTVYDECENAKDDNDKNCNEGLAKGLEIGFGAMSVAGAITLTIGAVTLSRRLRERREIDRQLRSLRNRLSTVGRSGIQDLVVGVGLTDGGARVHVGMSF